MVSILENKITNKKNSSKKSVKVLVKNKKNDLTKKDHEHFNSITRSVGISCTIMTIIVVTISPSSVWILGPVIGAMCIFGIAMGYFSSK